jgi:hypothetical protein
MRRPFLRALVSKLIAALFLTSGCGPGVFVFVRHLEFRGSAPTEVSGTGADDTAVVTALATLMTGRVYDPGTYMQYEGAKSNKSRLQNGAVTSYVLDAPIDFTNPQAGLANGNGQGSGAYYTMDFTLPEGPHLTVRFIYNVGQGMLNEVAGDGGAEESQTTDVADCNLTGSLAGKTVDLDFKQLLHGVANANYYGY